MFDFRILLSIYVLIRLTLVVHSTAFYVLLSLWIIIQLKSTWVCLYNCHFLCSQRRKSADFYLTQQFMCTWKASVTLNSWDPWTNLMGHILWFLPHQRKGICSDASFAIWTCYLAWVRKQLLRAIIRVSAPCQTRSQIHELAGQRNIQST